MASGFPMVDNPNLSDMRETARTDYGARLYKARKKHAKISQQALAEAVGTAQSNIAELETTGQGSSFTPQFAKRLGVRVEWLATGEEPMLPVQSQQARSSTAQESGAAADHYDLATALQTVGRAIESADAATREDVLAMLTLFVRNPTANAGQLPLLLGRLSGESGGQATQRGSRQA